MPDQSALRDASREYQIEGPQARIRSSPPDIFDIGQNDDDQLVVGIDVDVRAKPVNAASMRLQAVTELVADSPAEAIGMAIVGEHGL
jgi:hypothetical protein